MGVMGAEKQIAGLQAGKNPRLRSAGIATISRVKNIGLLTHVFIVYCALKEVTPTALPFASGKTKPPSLA